MFIELPTIPDVTISIEDLANKSSAQIAQYFQLLNADEQGRAKRFHFEIHQHHFIIARARLRLLLSDALAIAPDEIEFEYLAHGKPIVSLAQNPQGLQFNISHSHERALYALSYQAQIGIDIEYRDRREKDYLAIAKRFFANNEYQKLVSLSQEQLVDAFFNCWTRKEAFIKAIGDGLSYPLEKFEVSLLADEPAQFISINGSVSQAQAWQLYSFVPEQGYQAAVALSRQHLNHEKPGI